MQSTYKSIIESEDMTVVSDYSPLRIDRTQYQSEADLENDFINRLIRNGYERLSISSEEELINNLRLKIETLNKIKFSDDEWDRLYSEHISNPNLSIIEKTTTIQKDEVKTIKLDDGTSKNIKLVDKREIFNNSFQVMNQYTTVGNRENRYDVTILINGFPLIHIELKRRGVPLKEAFNQIERYQKDSFWAGSSLYEFVQIFVISNGTFTKYYSNSTRWNVTEGKTSAKRKRTSNSFEFTSFWADAKNNPIYSLEDFTNTFLTKRNLLNIIFKYCVLTVDNELLVMRPYQISATERIINRIVIANNYKLQGSIKGGGYIWHTTGSGKTLTSFKTATLTKDLDFVKKVMFVVDRKDLDYQTIKEYDRFEKGCVSGNKSTSILKRQLEDDNVKIVVTTIQKLNIFIKQNKTHKLYNENVVMIFDECHRSQFGEAHKNIVKAFKKYFLFGFTGTPIFPENAVKTKNNFFCTTEQTFGDRLHTYTIIDAIRDDNVLKFLVDRVRTMSTGKDIEDEKVESIDSEGALIADKRIKENVSYILGDFKRKTKDRTFNSILATQSIPMAVKYYKEFKKRETDLKFAIIYSYSENEDPDGIFMDDENNEATDGLDASSRDFLENAIRDYNIMFGTNFDTTGEKFQNYYKDVSKRMKEKQLDLLIVVNMFLTGFDAKTLNTLWVDKNLKYHGLLQAFSRTNRIYNSVKAYGNIVCFRNLDDRIEEAMTLFGNKDAGGVILLKDYDSYYNGYIDEKGIYHKGYKELVEYLLNKFISTEMPLTKDDKRDFINSFNAILTVMNILSVFERFENERLISDFDFQNYTSIYNELRAEFKKDKTDKESVDVTEDIVFETELVRQFEINIDYILSLLEKYVSTGDVEIIPTIKKLIASSFELRSKKVLIEAFIENIDAVDNVQKEWSDFIQRKAIEELEEIIKDKRLKRQETIDLMDYSLRTERPDFDGLVLDKVMPPMSIFGGRLKKKEEIKEVLQEYYDKYAFMIYSLKVDNYL